MKYRCFPGQTNYFRLIKPHYHILFLSFRNALKGQKRTENGAIARQNLQSDLSDQRRLRSACASALSDQSADRMCLPQPPGYPKRNSDWRPGGCGFNPRRGRQHSFVEIDHEIFSTVILSLPLIQEGQFWRKNVHNTGEPLRGLSLPSKRMVR